MQPRTLRLLEFEKVLDLLGAYALSEAGRRKCLDIRPCQDLHLLQAQNDLVRQALQNKEYVLAALNNYPDLQGLFAHVRAGHVLDEDALWAVRLALEQIRRSYDVISGHYLQDYSYLLEFLQKCPWPDKSWQALQRCLDQNGDLKDSSSPELQEIRTQVRSIQKQCRKRLEDYLHQKNAVAYLQDEYLTISGDRYVLAVKTNFKGRMTGIVHDYSQTGETCYFEPLELVELNNRLQELKHREIEARKQVLRYLTSVLNQELEKLTLAYDWLVDLDVLQAKVRLAEFFQGSILEMGPDSKWELRKVRHPLLVLEQDFVQELDISLQPNQKALLVTGGNAGGKTVCLKTLGICVLMGLSAVPVPAQEGSSLPFWRDIHVFLGDEQSLQESLSTFTAQIEHFRQAWPALGAESLVLLDEFGAGTDPSQGAALAQAVLEAVLDKEGWLAVATHFPALKVYALSDSRIRAASVLFDPDTKQPLYRLAYDQVGASQALEVAREHGLPEEVLQRAQEYLLLQGEDTTRLVERLNNLEVQRQQEIEELQRQKRLLGEQEKKLKEDFEQKKQSLFQEIRSTAQDILKRWQQDKIGRKQALRELGELKGKLQSSEESQEAQAETEKDFWSAMQPGQSVYCPVWDRSGRILELESKKNKVKVDLGGVNLWLSPRELRPVVQEQGGKRNGLSYAPGGQEVGLSLDLRGKRAEEAEAELSRSLDQALLQGREELEVVHGKGAGVLRQVVHELASSFPGVQGHQLAPEDRGGDGVTIISLQ